MLFAVVSQWTSGSAYLVYCLSDLKYQNILVETARPTKSSTMRHLEWLHLIWYGGRRMTSMWSPCSSRLARKKSRLPQVPTCDSQISVLVRWLLHSFVYSDVVLAKLVWQARARMDSTTNVPGTGGYSSGVLGLECRYMEYIRTALGSGRGQSIIRWPRYSKITLYSRSVSCSNDGDSWQDAGWIVKPRKACFPTFWPWGHFDYLFSVLTAHFRKIQRLSELGQERVSGIHQFYDSVASRKES